MSREIKFRVMDVDGNWHYYTLGDFVCLTPIPAQLRPETWTQFTGVPDTRGVEIFEGDVIVEVTNRIYFVEYNEGWASFVFHRVGKQILKSVDDLRGVVVIGNIHQNPELLK